MINLYTKYKSTGEWDKQGAYHNKVLVALTTALKQEPAKNKKVPATLIVVRLRLLPQSLETLPVRLHGILEMLGIPIRALITGPSTSGAIFTAGKTTKGYRTAYIWLNPTTTVSGKPAGPNTMLILKDKHQAKKKRKSEADDAYPPKKADDRNLSLAKSFKYELSTQVMLSNQ